VSLNPAVVWSSYGCGWGFVSAENSTRDRYCRRSDRHWSSCWTTSRRRGWTHSYPCRFGRCRGHPSWTSMIYQGLCRQGQCMQGHCSLSSGRLVDEAKFSRTHHSCQPSWTSFRRVCSWDRNAADRFQSPRCIRKHRRSGLQGAPWIIIEDLRYIAGCFPRFRCIRKCPVGTGRSSRLRSERTSTLPKTSGHRKAVLPQPSVDRAGHWSEDGVAPDQANSWNRGFRIQLCSRPKATSSRSCRLRYSLERWSSRRWTAPKSFPAGWGPIDRWWHCWPGNLSQHINIM